MLQLTKENCGLGQIVKFKPISYNARTAILWPLFGKITRINTDTIGLRFFFDADCLREWVTISPLPKEDFYITRFLLFFTSEKIVLDKINVLWNRSNYTRNKKELTLVIEK